ncbi:MAG: succinate dehydrogenase [Saccharolobus sp.]|jgi:succinate dehydrogenase/fumarate reductase subunit D|uniref:Succinate dehydrogenase subunit D n=1 Tax=Saccharolobus caldissimus TaxID=1702097 RepID=A0AAQ4CSY1_9CREN|nr:MULTISPECIES: succinate dehydrogenase [Saccharolobus]MDT7860635.1 succinate dehydrogenase [Saccharolobus sp.]BDB98912.1 hypothetical protein SACC_19290 [Saccharolobus caldissimus]
MSEEIRKVIESLGGRVEEWYNVSERPGREPFAKEANYSFDYFWGKIHLRNEGELYILIISRDVFNWKDRVKELKLNGEIIDAAGGLMWIQENGVESLKKDLEFLKNYLESLRKQKQKA